MKKILPILLSVSFLFAGCRRKPAEPQPTPVIPDIVETTVAPETPKPTETPAAVEATEAPAETTPEPAKEPEPAISEDTRCDDKDCVALYVYTYGHLPSNYMSKKEARKRGWNSGALSKVLKGMAIGGDRFGNMEGYLPDQYNYTECDIDTIGKKSRGAKRIVFADGGVLVYYTEDHYETFELLYGEE
ncbi:MAG: hypothetical protein IIZ10_05160 [Solobacterium sp.]|nr:hypothetical protein [Solobacterium sp.]